MIKRGHGGFIFFATLLVMVLSGEEVRHRRYTSAQGLSENAVTSLFQDRKGFLWVGTQDGLNRFDGSGFLALRSELTDTSTLSDSWVNGILLEDSREVLWVVTNDRVINLVDLKSLKVQRLTPDPRDPSSLTPFRGLFRVKEDSQGRVWLANDRGVFLWNPRQKGFRRLFIGAPPRYEQLFRGVRDVLEIEDGRFLLATLGGIVTLERDLTHFKVRFEAESQGGVIGFGRDSQGRLWGLSGENLLRFEPERVEWTSFPLPERGVQKIGKVRAALPDRRGNLWLSLQGNLYAFDPLRGTFTLHEGLKRAGADVRALFLDRGGRLWAGSADGLYRIDQRGGYTRFDIATPGSDGNRIVGITQDKAGDLWLNGPLNPNNGGILTRFSPSEGRSLRLAFSSGSQPVDHFFPPLQDNGGNLWFGTFGSGLFLYSPGTRRFHHLHPDEGLIGVNVFSFVEDDRGRIWTGIFDKGIDIYDPKTRKHSSLLFGQGSPVSFPNAAPMALCKGREGEIWAATLGGGLVRVDSKSGKLRIYRNLPSDPRSLPSNALTSCAVDRYGGVWVGTTGQGGARLDPKTGLCQRFPPSRLTPTLQRNGNLWAILEDRKGRIWMALDGMTVLYDPLSGSMTRFPGKSSDGKGVRAERVISLLEDSRGRIWLGTGTEGLALYDEKRGLFRHWGEREGLANNVVYSLLEDSQGALWMGTNKGLSRFDTEREKFFNYDLFDGLQENEFNIGAALRLHDGRMIFGGVNGATLFNPASLGSDPLFPPVVITQLQIYNKPVEVTGEGDVKTAKVKRGPKGYLLPLQPTYLEEIVLGPKEKVFTLGYGALHFTGPERNRFRYILEGFDREWIDAGNRRYATYTNLPAGSYLFKVTAANPDGVWNPKPVTLRIRILPPFWKSFWAYLFYLGVAVSLLVAGRGAVLRRERERTAVKESELRARAAEAQSRLVQQENNRKSRELEEARQLQLSMLPLSLPKVQGAELAVAMKTAAEVGGDYYDGYEERGESTLVLGDATHHGLKAGIMVSVVKGLFLSCSSRMSSLEFFHHTNITLKKMHLGPLYMGLTLCRYREGRIRIVCAGMPPAYILAREGFRRISASGIPLGALEDFVYEEREEVLGEGESLVLFTDGLAESFNAEERLWGLQGVERALAECRRDSAQEILRCLLSKEEEWRGSDKPLTDDMTVIVLRRSTEP
ncbi:MAG TPA: two-component regulator propeller domain-containing protein [Candidatus Aminicenantes bacterium]|nr:two-component regulator propeller domain-containing protein [Candidatus Aminicenantes bacterium]